MKCILNSRTKPVVWNSLSIEAELREAQIGDQWTKLSSYRALAFIDIGAAHGMKIEVTLGGDGLFVAKFAALAVGFADANKQSAERTRALNGKQVREFFDSYQQSAERSRRKGWTDSTGNYHKVGCDCGIC